MGCGWGVQGGGEERGDDDAVEGLWGAGGDVAAQGLEDGREGVG